MTLTPLQYSDIMLLRYQDRTWGKYEHLFIQFSLENAMALTVVKDAKIACHRQMCEWAGLHGRAIM